MSEFERIYHRIVGPQRHEGLKEFVQAARAKYQPSSFDSSLDRPNARAAEKSKRFKVVEQPAPPKNNDPIDRQARYEASGGNREEWFAFESRLMEADTQNRIAHLSRSYEKRRTAYNTKSQALMDILKFRRKDGLRCVSVGIEYDPRYPGELDRSFVSIEISIVDYKRFHMRYVELVALANQRGYQDSSELVGNWDFQREGISRATRKGNSRTSPNHRNLQIA